MTMADSLVESRSIFTGKTYFDSKTKKPGILYRTAYRNIAIEIFYIHEQVYFDLPSVLQIIGHKTPGFILSNIRKWYYCTGDRNYIYCTCTVGNELKTAEFNVEEPFVSFVTALGMLSALLGQESIDVEAEVVETCLMFYKRLESSIGESEGRIMSKIPNKMSDDEDKMNCCGVNIDCVVVKNRIYLKRVDFEKLINGMVDWQDHDIIRNSLDRILLWPHREEDPPHLLDLETIEENSDFSAYLSYDCSLDYISYIGALYICDLLNHDNKITIIRQILEHTLKGFKGVSGLEALEKIERTKKWYGDISKADCSYQDVDYDDFPF